MDHSPNISSFVVRFIVQEESLGHLSLRGSIRHIQSNQEINFNRWQEAETFMQSFIPVPLSGQSIENKPDI